MGSKTLGFVATIAGVGLLSSLAQAQGAFQTCAQDDDCPTGTRCSLQGSDPVEPKPEPDLPPPRDTPALAALVEGTCEPLPDGVCESDRDCDRGFSCVKDGWASGCAGPVGSEVDCEPSSGESRYGECELKPISCTTNADCPNGLSCADVDEGDGDAPCSSDSPNCGAGSNGDGGGTTGSVSKAATKVCTFVLQPCEATSDCAANYECAVSTVTSCSGGGREPGAADVCDSESGDCFAAPQEPECTVEQTEGVCVPKHIPCTESFECPSAYVCHELDAELVPDSWDEAGSVKTCLPEGIALIARYGARDLGGPNYAGSDGDSGGEVSNGEDDDAKSPGSLGAAKKGDGSACSVSVTRNGSSWLLVALGALGLCLVRRRRAA